MDKHELKRNGESPLPSKLRGWLKNKWIWLALILVLFFVSFWSGLLA